MNVRWKLFLLQRENIAKLCYSKSHVNELLNIACLNPFIFKVTHDYSAKKQYRKLIDVDSPSGVIFYC